ncbi:MAG: putative symporter YjmB [Verrucomicrobia bacterium ADurb.Bin345]|nr:MAG: putative symporter YjmB [Verrucomicrobia bacterium ADurb.Bin345]
MNAPEHHVTAPEDRIRFGQKLAYGLGMLANNVQAAAVGAMGIILNLGLGMNPALVGILGSVPRFVDALTDPVMGYVSDNTRSRYGRRRPYIFVGAILAGLMFIIMWQLYPGRSQRFYFWLFMITSNLFFVAYTIYVTPLIALGYELTPDYHERTRLMGFSNFLGQFAWLAAPWFYRFTEWKRFFDNPVQGARTLAIVIGIFIAVFGVIPAIFTRERFSGGPKDREGLWNNVKKFFLGFIVTWKSGPFILLCFATFLVFNGYMLGSTFTPYAMIYYVFGGNRELGGTLMGWFGTLSSVCTFFIIMLTAWISSKIGKRKTFFIMISLSLVGFVLKWFCYNTEKPYLLLASAPFIACGIGSLFTVVGAMVADVCDLDELKTGERREGMYGAIYWWMVKIGMSAAMLIAGFLLNLTGFDVALDTAQSERTLLLLRAFDVGIPLLTSAIAIVLIMAYSITEKRAYEIRAELEKRRGKRA